MIIFRLCSERIRIGITSSMV